MREIIAICTSYKFSNEAIECYKKLTDMGYIVLFPAMGCSEHNKEWYMSMHFEKIKMSNAIFVVNVGGYIGESVREEIAYAKRNNIKVIYLEDCSHIFHIL